MGYRDHKDKGKAFVIKPQSSLSTSKVRYLFLAKPLRPLRLKKYGRDSCTSE